MTPSPAISRSVCDLQPHAAFTLKLFTDAGRVEHLHARVALACVHSHSRKVRAVAMQVANKAIELLMSNDGQEVCCTDEADAQRLKRLGTAKSRQAAS